MLRALKTLQLRNDTRRLNPLSTKPRNQLECGISLPSSSLAIVALTPEESLKLSNSIRPSAKNSTSQRSPGTAMSTIKASSRLCSIL
jgi:hypothetical protein